MTLSTWKKDIPKLGLVQQFSVGRRVAPSPAVDLEQQDGIKWYGVGQVQQPSNGNAGGRGTCRTYLRIHVRRFTTVPQSRSAHTERPLHG